MIRLSLNRIALNNLRSRCHCTAPTVQGVSKHHVAFGILDLDLYTVDDISKRVGIKRATVYEAIKAGRLKAANFGGSSGYRIRKTALISWLADAESQRDVVAHRPVDAPS